MGSDQKETREVLAGKHGHQYETAVDRGPLPKMSLRAVLLCQPWLRSAVEVQILLMLALMLMFQVLECSFSHRVNPPCYSSILSFFVILGGSAVVF